MDLSKKIKQLRKEANLTQNELADKLLVHSQTVSKWERGLIEPDISLLGELATALGVTVDELLGLPESDVAFGGTFSPDRFGKSLYEKRTERNESQEAVGAALNVSGDTVSRWERGVTCPSPSELCDLANYYDVPVSKLYFGAETDVSTPKTINVGKTEINVGKSKRTQIALIASLALCFVLSLTVVAIGVALSDKPVYTISVDGENIHARQGESFYPTAPERVGYDFVGWYDSDENPISLPHIVKKNCKFTSRYKLHEYSLSLWLNGGSLEQTPPDKFTVETGTVELPVPKKTGADFLGWYLHPAYEGESSSSVECGPYDLVVYAKWSYVVYTVEYELNGGTMHENNPVQITSEKAEKLNAPVKIGYDFLGWYDSPDGGKAYEFVGGSDSMNMTLYALWQKSDVKHKIEYEYNGGICEVKNPEIIRSGEIIVLSEPFKTGHDFKGWNDRADGSGTYYTRLFNLTSDLKLYAIFKPKRFLIVYRYDGAYTGASNPNYVFYGEKIKLNPVALHGYEFEGWYTDAKDGKKIEEINKTNVAKITALYARYRIIEYTIKLDLQGGTLPDGEKDEYRFTVESPEFTLPKPKKPGFKFLGWFDENGKAYRTITATEAGDFTLTAKWLDENKIYNVTYVLDCDDATHDNPWQNKCGNALFLEPARRAGYEFLGWSFEPNGEITDSVPAENENDVTLYANWQIIKESGSANDFLYEKTINGVKIKSYVGNFGENVTLVVPSKIDGADVVEIDKIIDYGSEQVYLKRLVLPDGVLKLGRLFHSWVSVTDPVEIPASVTELGDYCFQCFCGKIKFAPDGNLKTIGIRALSGKINNPIILPDSLETLSNKAIIYPQEVVLSKNLKTLLNSAIGKNSKIFFPEGISKSLTFIESQAVNTEWYELFVPRSEETALRNLFNLSGVVIDESKFNVIDKHSVTLDYGNRTETFRDYFLTLPQIESYRSAFIGWTDESSGALYQSNGLFFPDKDVTLKAIYVPRSEKDGLSEETAEEITPGAPFEIYLASNGFVDKTVKRYFTVKTSGRALIKIGYATLKGSLPYALSYGDDNAPLPADAFWYTPGTVIRVAPSKTVNKVFAAEGCCKIAITVTIRNEC